MTSEIPEVRLDDTRISKFVDETWERDIIPELETYIEIPAKSPAFDADWRANGHIDEAVAHIEAWCRTREIKDLEVEVVRLEGRTPLIYMEHPGIAPYASGETVLLYGHLDKQPEMSGWRDGLGPWKPVRENDKLYGRGGADDGYAAYASLTAIEALHRFDGKHGRCVILIEGCEESGSYDLPFYIDALAERIGAPNLVVCLDSGCGNYDQLWSTTSLRGLVSGTLRVDILDEGVHSGDASGIVASSFRIARQLLSRIDDEGSGAVRVASANVEIPPERVIQAGVAAQNLGDMVWHKFPFVDGARATGSDLAELILNRTWRPALSVTGQSGLPDLGDAGNVLRPTTSLALSLRIPPTARASEIVVDLEKALTEDPPYGARITAEFDTAADGWDAPPLAGWLEAATDDASMTYFGKPAVYMGEGGTIPFMGMLGEKFPDAQFLITGLLGPGSNAHGPNEFLHIPTGKKLTACVAHLLMAHALWSGRTGSSVSLPNSRQ